MSCPGQYCPYCGRHIMMMAPMGAGGEYGCDNLECPGCHPYWVTQERVRVASLLVRAEDALTQLRVDLEHLHESVLPSPEDAPRMDA